MAPLGTISRVYDTIVAGGVVLDLSAPLIGSLWRAKMDPIGQKAQQFQCALVPNHISFRA